MKEHTDPKDIKFQYGFTIGDYEGGHLFCQTTDGKEIKINNQRKVVRFDGRNPHYVSAVAKGKRFSFLFFL